MSNLLVLRDTELFPEEICAWKNGPVVKEVYQKLQDGRCAACVPENTFDSAPDLEPKDAAFLKHFWDAHSGYSAGQLCQRPFIGDWEQIMKAIFKGGAIVPLEPVPAEWDEGTALEVAKAEGGPVDMDAWKALMDRLLPIAPLRKSSACKRSSMTASALPGRR